MRSAEEVPVEHLVADSGAFIKQTPLQDVASKIYTIPEVINELKCDRSKFFIQKLPYEIIIKEPETKTIRTIVEFSKKTGDYSALSVIDLKVLALTHDLHTQFYGDEHKLKYEVTPQSTYGWTDGVGNKTPDNQKEISVNVATIAGFYTKPIKEDSESESDSGPPSESASTPDDDPDDNGGWLDEESIDDALRELNAVAVPEEHMKVACITTDFAMQNVILHMGLMLVSIGGYRIRRLNSYVLRCHSCFAVTKDVSKRYCSECGNETLRRVAVTINDDGSVHLYFNYKRSFSTRGLKYSLPAPKGGKHGNDPQLFEDQRMPQNRLARCRNDPLSTDPFLMNDISSRSSVLGLRSLQRPLSGNPNANRRGKKRGGKKR